jgi:hypothetical protein
MQGVIMTVGGWSRGTWGFVALILWGIAALAAATGMGVWAVFGVGFIADTAAGVALSLCLFGTTNKE